MKVAPQVDAECGLPYIGKIVLFLLLVIIGVIVILIKLIRMSGMLE
jgi:hypothetical protein